jgi:hypothetical protein
MRRRSILATLLGALLLIAPTAAVPTTAASTSTATATATDRAFVRLMAPGPP